MQDRMTPAERLALALDFFRFAHKVGGPISFGLKFDLPALPDVWSFGKHTLEAEDFDMSEEAFELCGTILERLAYRLLAMELNSALENTFGTWKTRRDHTDEFLRNACIVVWMIRNSVAHDILEPIWKIDDPSLQNRKFVVSDILTFDTTGLNGRFLRRLDFGGL